MRLFESVLQLVVLVRDMREHTLGRKLLSVGTKSVLQQVAGICARNR